MSLSEEAKAARREYQRRWREKNKERIAKTYKEWRSKPENKQKIKEYQKRYWERKAQELNEVN